MLEKLNIRAIHGPFSRVVAGRVPGATEPWLATGTDEAGIRQTVILKPAIDYCPFGPHHCLDMLVREFVCSIIFRQLGVAMPTAYVAAIPTAVARMMGHYPLMQEALLKSPWPHFATKYLENMADVQPGQRLLHDAHVEAAEDIFAADNLVVNADRSFKKPNLLYDAASLIAIDHGLAFAAIRAGEMWDALPLSHQTQHACYATLKKSTPKFERVLAAWVTKISEELLDDIRFALPAEWMHTSIDAHVILNHLREHDGRLNKIAANLKLAFA